MTWTVPRTWTTGEVVAGAMFNAIRDDFFEEETSKAAAAGDMFYATAAGALARLPKGNDGEFLTLVAGLPSWHGATRQVLGSDQAQSGLTPLTVFSKAIGAGERWAFRYVFVYTLINGALSDAIFSAISAIPAGSSGFLTGYTVNDVESFTRQDHVAAPASGTVFTNDAMAIRVVNLPQTNINAIQIVEGVVTAGGSGGTLTFAVCANNSTPTCTIKKYSYLEAERLA